MEPPTKKNACEICGKGFNRIEKLNVHRKSTHEAKGTKFSSPSDEVANLATDSDSDNNSGPSKKIKLEVEDGAQVQRSPPNKNSVEYNNKTPSLMETKKVESENLGPKSVIEASSPHNHSVSDVVDVVEARTKLKCDNGDAKIADSFAGEATDVPSSDKMLIANCSESKDVDLELTEKCGNRTEKDERGWVSDIVNSGNKVTISAERKLDQSGCLVTLKEKTENNQSDEGSGVQTDKTTTVTNCRDAKSEEPSWLIALKEKNEKELKNRVGMTTVCSRPSVVNHSKVSAIEPACLIEVSDVALSIPVSEPSVASVPNPEAKSAPVPSVPTTEGTGYRRDARLRKIIRPVKKLSYNEAYSDDLDDSDEKGSNGNGASSSKTARVKSSRPKPKSKTRNHTPVQKDIKCPMCPEVFHDLRGVKSHILVHLNDDTQICEVCQEEIPERQDLIMHLRGHVQVTYKCERCPSEFTKIGSFYHHRDKHLVEEDGFVYTCNICGKTLYNKWYLKEHKRKHNKKTTYICEVCGKMFSTKATLKAHLEAHTSVKHTCELCGKNYARRVGLLNHLRRDHEGIKKHECPDCGKKFFARKTLVQHTRIHTGEKPYACDFCGKTFTQKINRDQHRRLHTGEQPYRCEYCFKCFSLRAAYTQHLRTHTGFKVSEMNPSVLQPQQNLITEENNEDVENVAV